MAAALLALALAGASGRVALGQYGGWGAFREEAPRHCWAVAAPAGRVREPTAGAPPFVAIASWPGRGIAGQLHVRLRDARPGAAVTLRIGAQRFALLAGPADAWAHDAREDARIVAVMRRADQLAIEVRDARGRHYLDRYPLAGAPSAIDAAALGCLP